MLPFKKLKGSFLIFTLHFSYKSFKRLNDFL
ncbi:hypothetical protein BSNT_10372 [Bacillus subtilis subsp. natto BEST195]|nr:hypothetical protein BSNT_10372 [Bacillus subtilis subsp. natto BEST195]